MKRRLKWLLAAAAVLLFALAIGRAIDARRQQASRIATPAPTPAIELAAQDRVVLRVRELVLTQPVSGTLRARDTALIKARVAGTLQTLSVREGDALAAGQVIGKIDDADHAARLRQAMQQAAAARAQLELAERALADNRAMVERGFISRAALDVSVSNAAAARAGLLAAQAAAEVSRKAVDDTVLRAPIGGQVSQRFVQAGERLAVDARILEIVDLSQIELEATVPPDALTTLASGAAARLEVDGLGKPVGARVARISPAVAPGTRGVNVYLAVDKHPGLRHGLFASGRIELGRLSVLALPEHAIRNDRSRPYVLAIENGRIAAREIVVGTRGRSADDDIALVEVRQGLDDGALVLAGRLGRIADGTPVAPTDAR